MALQPLIGGCLPHITHRSGESSTCYKTASIYLPLFNRPRSSNGLDDPSPRSVEATDAALMPPTIVSS